MRRVDHPTQHITHHFGDDLLTGTKHPPASLTNH